MALVVKNPPAKAGHVEAWVQSLGWEDPLEEGTATHSRILVWRIPMDGGPWRAIVLGLNTTEWLSIAYVAVRGLASMFLSISCHQLLMASHCTPHIQGSRLLRSLGWEDPLEEEMATHSSILAWEVPWTEEPGGLESMGVIKSQTRRSTPQDIFGQRERILSLRP